MKSSSKKVALYGISLALCMVLGYLEHLIPLPVGIYGIKLGLANLGTVVLLMLLGPLPALCINTLRILLSSLLFGNAVSLIYSLCGGLLSALVMILMSRTRKFGCMGISLAGGVAHNAAQMCVAVIMVDNLKIAFYLPVLMISGTLAGCAVGAAALPLVSNKYLKNLCDK